MNNKNEILLSNLLINWISAKSAPQLFSIKNECFPFEMIFLEFKLFM